MMRSLLRWGLVALAAICATAPALAQNYRVIGAWRCIGASATGPIVYDVVFNADGYYSGSYTTTDGYRAYSEGPYNLTGTLLGITFQIWETQPQPSANPGAETFSVQFRGTEAMSILPTRCPQGPDCRFSCERHR